MNTCRDIKALLPEAQAACETFLKVCQQRNIPIFITETYRPQERQNELYAQGRTKPGQIVTWTLKSQHTSKLAWDIAVSPPHNLYDASILKRAGEVAKELGIEWGGAWNTPDYPHFQIKKGQIIKGVDDEVVTKAKMKINGTVKEVSVINKDGHNFVKLQDLKDWKIDVTYDAINKMPVVEARA